MKRSRGPFHRLALLVLVGLAFSGVPARAEVADSAAKDSAPKEAAPAVEKSEAPKFPLPPDHFSDVQDSDDKAMSLDLEGTQEILEALDHCTQDDLDKAVDPELGYRDLYDQPQNYRGKVASLSGVYRFVQEKILPEGVRTANGPKDGKVWLGQISIGRRYIINFISTEPIPANVKIGEGVSANGVFLKRFEYYSQGDNGHAVERGPLLFIKQLKKATLGDRPLPHDPVIEFVGGAIFLLITAGMSAYVYTRWQSKRSGVKYFSGVPAKSMFPGKNDQKGGIFPR